MAIELRVNSREAEAYLSRLVAGLKPNRVLPVLEKVAWRTHGALVVATPKFTGQTRRGWTVVRKAGMGYVVTNRERKVMTWLEKGTKGPIRPRRAKALFIPLTRTAAISGWNPNMVFGTDYVLAKQVKGIKAMKIVSKQRNVTGRWLRTAMNRHLSTILAP